MLSVGETMDKRGTQSCFWPSLLVLGLKLMKCGRQESEHKANGRARVVLRLGHHTAAATIARPLACVVVAAAAGSQAQTPHGVRATRSTQYSSPALTD